MSEIHTQRAGKDPVLERDFIIEIEGLGTIGFSEMSEIKAEYAKAEYREGNSPNYPYKQRGGQSFPDVTFSKGFTTDIAKLNAWYETGERKTVDITRLDHTQTRYMATHRLYEAFPLTKLMGKGDAKSEDGNVINQYVIAFDWYEDFGVST